MAGRAGIKKTRACDPFRFDRGVIADAVAAGRGEGCRLAGADEAGRGCLAGPLVAASVVLDYSAAPFAGLEGLTDSKQLSLRSREALFPLILAKAARVSWAAVSPRSIDEIGLHRCNVAALGRVVESLDGRYCTAVIDGFDLKRPELRSVSIVGADYKSAAVAAASIVAKVVRDRLMRTLAVSYPEYGFDEHVGYGTEQHREALRRHGPCALHRLSFQGVGTSQLGLWDQ